MAGIQVPLHNPGNMSEKSAKPSLKQAVIVDLHEVKKSPKGFWTYFTNAFSAILQTIGFLIALAICNIIPIVMIIVGSVYINNCSAEPNIPIFLIVGGVFAIVKSIIQIINRTRLSKMVKTNPEAKLRPCDPLNLLDSLISKFLFIWLIVGSIWVFRIAMPEFNDEKKPAYCHRGLYLFSYILLIIGWICLAIFLFIMCFCLGAVCCVGIAAGVAEAMDDGHNAGHTTNNLEPPATVVRITPDTD